MRLLRLAVLLGAVLVLCASALAQDSDDDLAKKSHNPTANMISLPLQNNTNFGAGPQDATTSNDFNIQPVYPLGVGNLTLSNHIAVCWNQLTGDPLVVVIISPHQPHPDIPPTALRDGLPKPNVRHPVPEMRYVAGPSIVGPQSARVSSQ